MKNNYDYIKKLSGILLEGKYSDVIKNKIGLPEEISNELEVSYGKYSIWFANVFLKSIKERYDLVNFDTSLKNEDSELFDFMKKEFPNYKNNVYDYVSDWLKGRNSGPVTENDKIDFKTLTIFEALDRADAWHKKLEQIQTGKIEDEQGDVVMTFPDGFYWIKLNSHYCEDESEAMGHCGRGNGILYSLRKNKQPFITADIDNNGKILQMRGRANTKPKKEYHKYILDFILSDTVKDFSYNSFKPEENFYISDLDEEYINKIIEEKPSLFNGQKFTNFSDEVIEKLIDKNLNVFPISKYYSNDLSIDNIIEKTPKIISVLSMLEFKRFISDVKESGNYFVKFIEESIKSNFLEIIKDNLKNKGAAKEIIITLTKEMPSFKDYIKEVFLKDDKYLKLFTINMGNVLQFIEIICLKSIFGNEGIAFAVKLMKKPEVKENIIKQYSSEYYNAIFQEMVDTIVSSIN